ncbi:hypothetical protein BS47DRAFT_453106 [Hydnum rufescens UP504]|uniref:Uncharacterized protein n=1 Tax=Hydnum rufescens UP504 TaxID=1448309 RepID=A0A9P6AJ30_9AGAM|nr:hypothetical protein BS47DRAFT_453106 [Hydnum rufescens UP504]
MEAHVDGSRLRLPLPTPVDNSLKLSFTLADSVNGLDVTPDSNSELATAELCIAANGTFVETTSANAARELKRRYDQLWGVGQDGKRSPYAITAVVNQFGRRVFRVSHHEEQIPSDDQLHLPPPPEDDAKETRSKPSRASLLFSRSTLPKQSRHSHGFSTSKSKSSTSPPSLRHVFSGPSPSRSIPELSGTRQGRQCSPLICHL